MGSRVMLSGSMAMAMPTASAAVSSLQSLPLLVMVAGSLWQFFAGGPR